MVGQLQTAFEKMHPFLPIPQEKIIKNELVFNTHFLHMTSVTQEIMTLFVYFLYVGHNIRLCKLTVNDWLACLHLLCLTYFEYVGGVHQSL